MLILYYTAVFTLGFNELYQTRVFVVTIVIIYGLYNLGEVSDIEIYDYIKNKKVKVSKGPKKQNQTFKLLNHRL